jgi:hypothetical protein
MTDYMVRVLDAFEKADLFDGLLWRVKNKAVTFAAICRDTFWWATADAEEINTDDLDLLERCLTDLKPHDEAYLLPELFAARKRNLRPMRLWLKSVDNSEVLKLFLDAGPERDPKSEG